MRSSIPLARHLIVRDGEMVKAGDALTDGSINPHDLLKVKGEKAVQEFLLGEVQEVYRLQGVTINDKHIESIIRQMLRRWLLMTSVTPGSFMASNSTSSSSRKSTRKPSPMVASRRSPGPNYWV